jgi:aminopeptidase
VAFDPRADYLVPLAELIVRFGANVQPGQIVALGSEPGKEPLARAVAEAAYRAGAKFVDLTVFDVHIKRARALHADPETLGFVPPWYGERMRTLGRERAARIMLSGPVAPHIMEGVDPALQSRDMLPAIRESIEVVNERTTNWTIGPCPTPGWAELVHPDLDPDLALGRLWEQIAHVCRLDAPDPVAAWEDRFARLLEVGRTLGQLALDAVRFEGPGTELTVGMLGSSRWLCADFATATGLVHHPNLPSEEVFTTPDPQRVEGVVRSTKPLFTSGRLITGLRIDFQGGRVVRMDADEGVETLRGLAQRDPGAGRLGEVALVDGAGRIGPLDTVFYDTLLDENAASHIALGQGFTFAIEGERDLERVNGSEIHIDFMIGGEDVAVTGVTREGRDVPLLRDGAWQI